MKLFRSTSWLLIAAVLAAGCVSTKKYKALEAGYTKLQNSSRELSLNYLRSEQSLAVAAARSASLEEQLSAERQNAAGLKDALNNCLNASNQGNVNISKLVDEINRSNRYIQQLVSAKNLSDSLNLVLTSTLTRSLSQQELRDVDVQVLKGVVYISLSDRMLYRSGSYEISALAGETLAKVARIIRDYSNYDVLIEGNTDNVPISQPDIRNNWDLSALRASSVVQALQHDYGVDPMRLTAGGRGEYNPVADNATDAGKALNRRTRLMITPRLDQFMDLIGKGPVR